MTPTQALAIAATRAMRNLDTRYVVETPDGCIVASDLDMTVRYAGERIISVARADGTTRTY